MTSNADEEAQEKERLAKREKDRAKRHKRDRAIFFTAGTFSAALLITMVVSYIGLRLGWRIWQDPASITESGSLGDAVGPFASLFSALALFTAVYGIIMQREELVLQREENEDNRVEQRSQKEALLAQANTLKRSALSQEASTRAAVFQQHVARVMLASDFYVKASEVCDAIAYMATYSAIGSATELHALGRMPLPALPVGTASTLLFTASEVRDALEDARKATRTHLIQSGKQQEAKARVEECERRLKSLHDGIRKCIAVLEKNSPQGLDEAPIAGSGN